MFSLWILCGLLGASAFAEQQVPVSDPTGVNLAPVIIDGKKLFRVRGIASYPATRRASEIRQRIIALADDETFDTSQLVVSNDEPDRSIVMAGDREIFNVFDEDAGHGRGTQGDDHPRTHAQERNRGRSQLEYYEHGCNQLFTTGKNRGPAASYDGWYRLRQTLRQVEAMLVEAAGRTGGVNKEPPPFVLQSSLGDFAVEYQVNAYCSEVKNLQYIYSDLHANIFDVFNEYGIQIMSPAYVADPESAKVVPPARWNADPAPGSE